MQIAYIHSLARSGSTFLQTMLSAHPNAVALGELSRVVHNYSQNKGHDPIDQLRDQLREQKTKLSNRPCYCGQTRENCSFWGDLLPQIQGEDLQIAHRKVLEKFQATSPGKLLIDNSKSRVSFDQFYGAAGNLKNESGLQNDIRLIFMIRDFRGWVRSNERHQTVAGKRRKGLRAFAKGYVADCYRWYFANKRFLAGLGNIEVPYCVLTYESLAFQFDRVFPLLGQFLGLEFDQIPPDATHLESHELFGSLGVKKQQGQLAVRYDGSWMTDSRALFYSPVLAPVYRLNSIWQKQFGVEGLQQQVDKWSVKSSESNSKLQSKKRIAA